MYCNGFGRAEGTVGGAETSLQRQVACRVPRGMSHMYLDRTKALRDGGGWEEAGNRD